MKEKISRFIEAFNMNGEVKRKTLTYGGIGLAIVILLIILLCLLPKKDKTVEEPAPQPEQVQPVEKPEEQAPVVEEPEVQAPEFTEPEEMKAILDKYPDAYAWIEMPGTGEALSIDGDLSYPIAQHPTDRGYYLDRDLDGNHYQPGTLFTEKSVEGRPCNSKDFSDPVTIIYGHNQANRTMFGGQQSYLSKMDFSEQHLIYIYQPERRITYQIVGGVQYDTSHIIYYHDFSDDAVFTEFFGQLKKETEASTNIDFDNWPVVGDKVLILSVCKNGDNNHRYLVVAKMIEDTADPATWTVDAPEKKAN